MGEHDTHRPGAGIIGGGVVIDADKELAGGAGAEGDIGAEGEGGSAGSDAADQRPTGKLWGRKGFGRQAEGYGDTAVRLQAGGRLRRDVAVGAHGDLSGGGNGEAIAGLQVDSGIGP